MAVAFAMLPMSLAVPRPDGGSKGTPAIAGGQLATGRPGQVTPSTITRLPGFLSLLRLVPAIAGWAKDPPGVIVSVTVSGMLCARPGTPGPDRFG
jgi:hypothetical protein